jgi:hypothetical protein
MGRSGISLIMTITVFWFGTVYREQWGRLPALLLDSQDYWTIFDDAMSIR